MGDSSKKHEERKHLEKRREWAGICQKLEDDNGEMSSDVKQNLLIQRLTISIDIWLDLKEEDKILQDDINYWENDIEQLKKECGMDSSSNEESEEDEKESQSSNGSQCASSDEESEADEKESQCKLCNARSYLEYLDTEYGGLWDSEEDYEAYQKAEQELEELESEDLLEDLPSYAFCTTCFEHDVKKFPELGEVYKI